MVDDKKNMKWQARYGNCEPHCENHACYSCEEYDDCDCELIVPNTIDTTIKWFSVKERLPNERWVLVAGKCGLGDYVFTIGSYFSDETGFEFFYPHQKDYIAVPWDDNTDLLKVKDIEYWAYLPNVDHAIYESKKTKDLL